MLNATDRRAIEDLVRSADEAATRRDEAGYAALYAEDGIMDGSEGRAEGRVAIRAAVKAVWACEPAGSQHLTRNIAITDEADGAIARSKLVIAVPGAATPFAQAAIEQTLRRTAEGWRIARRAIATDEVTQKNELWRNATTMKPIGIGALLSFNGGFVDTAGFLGLQGLFTAHVTGNFVTLGAALVFGTHGVIAKLIALPEFIAVIAVARVAGAALRSKGIDALRVFLVVKVIFLLAFFLLAVTLGPFPDSDSPAALLTGLAGIAGMAIQNAVQRVHLAHIPPTTLMTGNTTQAVLDAVDLLRGTPVTDAAAIRARFSRTVRGIFWFAAGCAVSALLHYWFGFWCLAVPVAVGAATAIPRDDGGPLEAPAAPQALAKGP